MHLRIISQVSFVAIALMSIQVYDHELFDPMPLPQIMADESDVGVDAESASIIAGCVVIPP